MAILTSPADVFYIDFYIVDIDFYIVDIYYYRYLSLLQLL